MPYIDEQLESDEEVLCRGGLSPAVYFAPAAVSGIGFVLLNVAFIAQGNTRIVAGAFGVLCFLLSKALFFGSTLRSLSCELVVTNKRVITKSGITQPILVDTPLSRVQDVKVHDGTWGSKLAFGSIEIQAGATILGPVSWIAKPHEFREALLGHVNDARSGATVRGRPAA